MYRHWVNTELELEKQDSCNCDGITNNLYQQNMLNKFQKVCLTWVFPVSWVKV